MTTTSPTHAPRYNEEAEECVIGAAMFVEGNTLSTLLAELEPMDFGMPTHREIWTALRALHDDGQKLDAVTVSSRLDLTGKMERGAASVKLIGYTSNLPSIGHALSYSKIVREEASARSLRDAARETLEAINQGAPADTAADELESRLRHLDRGGQLPERYWRSTAEYLRAEKGESGEPVIPKLIGPRGRTLLLASEKSGKSVLERQVCECVAGGLHPWTFEPLPEPIPTLILDAENDDDELELTLPYLDEILTARLGADRGRPALFSAPYALDLRSRRDRSALEEVISDCRPRLIVGGPIVNFYNRRSRESEDEIISDLKAIFNDIRRRWGCALMIEHHSKTDRSEGLKSKGGQQWDAWTNATIGLYAQDGGSWLKVKHEHPPRGQVVWPKRFIRGTSPGDMPWIPSFTAGSPKDHSEPPHSDREAPQEEFEYQERIF